MKGLSRNTRILLILLAVSIAVFFAIHLLEEKEIYELSKEMVKEGEKYYQKKEYKKAKLFFDRALKRYNDLIILKIIRKDEIQKLKERIENDPILQKVAKGFIYYNGKWVNEKQLEALMKEKRRLKQKIDIYLKTAKFFGSIEDIENNITIYQNAVKEIEKSPFNNDTEIKQLKGKLIGKIIFLSKEAAKKYKQQGNLEKAAYYYELVLKYTDQPSLKEKLFEIYMKNIDEYTAEGKYIKALETALKAKKLHINDSVVLPKIDYLLSKIDTEEILSRKIEDPYIYLALAKKSYDRFDILEAQRLVEKSLNLNPDNVEAVILYGKILFTTGEYEKAEKLVKEAISKYGENPEALLILGNIYLKKGDFKNAILYLQKVSNNKKVKDRLFEAYKKLGILKLKEGNLKEAKDYLSKALDIKDDPQVYFSLGEVYFSTKEFKKAEKSYMNALKIDPSLKKNVKNRLSIIYFELGKREKNKNKCSQAVNYFKKAITYGGENSKIILLIAECYEKIGNTEKALAYYGKLKNQRLKEKEAVLYLKLGEEAFKKKKYFTALKNFKRAISLDKTLEKKLKSNIVSSYVQIGKIYYSQGKYEKAIQYFLKATKIDQSQKEKLREYMFDTYLTLGKKYFNSGMYSTAFDYLKKAEKIKPDSKSLLSYLGEIYLVENNYKKAAQYFEKYISKYGKNPEIISRLATIYAKLGNLKKAKNYAEEILNSSKHSGLAYYIMGAYSLYYEKNTVNALQFFLKAENRGYKKGELYYYMGRIYYSKGNYLRAITYLTKAIEKGYRKENVYFLRAISYLKLKDYRKAINDLTAVIKLNPENAKAYYLRGKLYYEHGNYVKGEYRKAIEDLEKAASMGVKEAAALLDEARSKR
ncbi:tetratricopeptide repeat protein [Persephonella atlantica]|uniref:Tetratricopeptide repeat protein n=1 Tax=Persephonella atlantica TaxID=2699429 RepID=A0ABS1GFY8_9AQUI|nr:tetratricopeptide repeat protein [Persephonella atlantica]